MPSGAGKGNASGLNRPRKAHFGPQQQHHQQQQQQQQLLDQHQPIGDVEDAYEFDSTGYQPPLRSNTSSSGDSGMMQHNSWKESHGRRPQQTQQQQQQQLGHGKLRGGNADCGCNIPMHPASQRPLKPQLPRYIPAHNMPGAFDAGSVDQETNSTCSDAPQEFSHHQAASGNYEVSDQSDGPDELEDESIRGSGGAATMAPTANNSYGSGRGMSSRQQQQLQLQQQQQQQQMKQQRRQQRTAPPLLTRRCHSDPSVSAPQQLYGRSPIMHNTCGKPLNSGQTSINRRVHADQTGSAQQVYNHSPVMMHGGNGKPPPIPQSGGPSACNSNGSRLPRQQKQQVIQQLVIQLIGCGDCPSCRRWYESSGTGGWQTQVQVLRSIHASCSGSVQLSQPPQQPMGHTGSVSSGGGGASRNNMTSRRSIREHPQQQID